MPTDSPGVTLILLNYNGWELVQQSLPTLVDQDYETTEIIIIDNGSTDDSVLKIKASFPEIKLLELSENQGFAGANNRGVEKATYQHVMLVSNDIRLPSNCVSKLMQQLLQDKNCAVVGPKIHNLNMDMTQFPKNGTLSLSGAIIQNVFSESNEVFGITGCAVLFDKQKLGKPFDEDYEFFHEDVYLAWHARLLGYSIQMVPDVEAIHIGEATVHTLGDKRRYLMERNRYLNILTFFSPATQRKLKMLLAWRQLIERFANRLAGKSNQPIDDALKWLNEHKQLIVDKHKHMQQQRRVDDVDIIKWMSYKLTNQSNLAGKCMNLLAYVWCLMKGLKTYEFGKRG